MTIDYTYCPTCGDDIHPDRAAIGYTLCLACGDKQAAETRKRWCIAPMNKSNYMLFTDYALLKQLNPKRTT
jgi:RNA polymerase-binding transcription factor DksA